MRQRSSGVWTHKKGRQNISAHVCDAGFLAVTKVPGDKISNVNTHACSEKANDQCDLENVQLTQDVLDGSGYRFMDA